MNSGKEVQNTKEFLKSSTKMLATRKYFENCERYDPKRQPSWLIHPPKSNENPDVIVPYSKYVYSIKSSESLRKHNWFI